MNKFYSNFQNKTILLSRPSLRVVHRSHLGKSSLCTAITKKDVTPFSKQAGDDYHDFGNTIIVGRPAGRPTYLPACWSTIGRTVSYGKFTKFTIEQFISMHHENLVIGRCKRSILGSEIEILWNLIRVELVPALLIDLG